MYDDVAELCVLLVDLGDELEELCLLHANIDLVSELRPSPLHPADPFPDQVKFSLKLCQLPQLFLLLLHCRLEYGTFLVRKLMLVPEVLVGNLQFVDLSALAGQLLVHLLL